MALTTDSSLELPADLKLELPVASSAKQDAQTSLRDEQFVSEEYLKAVRQPESPAKHKPAIEKERFKEDYDTTK